MGEKELLKSLCLFNNDIYCLCLKTEILRYKILGEVNPGEWEVLGEDYRDLELELNMLSCHLDSTRAVICDLYTVLEQQRLR